MNISLKNPSQKTTTKKTKKPPQQLSMGLNAFGQEWQVRVFEPKLFRIVEGAQAPQLCEAPSAVETRRRLGESFVTQQEAEIACSCVNPMDRDLCIFDVMATNDLDLAGAYWQIPLPNNLYCYKEYCTATIAVATMIIPYI